MTITPEQARAMRDAATPGPHEVEKCPCGDPLCTSYLLDTERSRGFYKADADLYSAAPVLATLYADTADKLAEVEKERDNFKRAHERTLILGAEVRERAEKAEAENKRLREELKSILGACRYLLEKPVFADARAMIRAVDKIRAVTAKALSSLEDIK